MTVGIESNESDQADECLARLGGLVLSLESVLNDCTRKYRNKFEIEELYSQLNSFVSRENLTESTVREEILLLDRECRKGGLNEGKKKLFGELKDRLKSLYNEVKCVRNLLDKSNQFWAKFIETYEQVDRWLSEQEQIGDIKYCDFDNYQRYQRSHALFNDSVNFLLQVSEEATCEKLKSDMAYLNIKWRTYQDRFKNTPYEHILKYYECEHSMCLVKDRLAKIESLMSRNVKCCLSSVVKHQEELQRAFNDIECLSANLNLILKLTSKINFDHMPEIRAQFDDDLKNTDAKLIQLKYTLPDCLKKLNKACAQLGSIEDGLSTIDNWINEGESLLRLFPDRLSCEQSARESERINTHFQDLAYYQNGVLHKIDIFQSLKCSVVPSFDYMELDNKLSQLNDSLRSLSDRRNRWNESFSSQMSLWNEFKEKTRALEEWIKQAQQVVSEKNEDHEYLIRKHMEFFNYANNSHIMNEFLSVGRKLIGNKGEREQAEIQDPTSTLEQQWQMVICYAPVRLLKLKFKHVESQLRGEMKKADTEISNEYLSLSAGNQASIGEVLKRHETKFKRNEFYSKCESMLETLRSVINDLREINAKDVASMEEVFTQLQNYWFNLTQKIDAIYAKLTMLPSAKDQFESNLNCLINWVAEFELVYDGIFSSDLDAPKQYKLLLDRVRAFISELSSRKQLLYNIQTQNEFLIKQNVLASSKFSPVVHELSIRFERLEKQLSQIESRSCYVSNIIKVYESLENLETKIEVVRTHVKEPDSISSNLKRIEMDFDQIKLDCKQLSGSGEYTQLPVIVSDKIEKVESAIAGSHRLVSTMTTTTTTTTHTAKLVQPRPTAEKLTSSIEIKIVNNQTLAKIDAINQLLDETENILSNKNLESDLPPQNSARLKKVGFSKSNECLLNTNGTVYASNANNRLNDYSKYIGKLSNCKDLIERAKHELSLAKSNDPSVDTYDVECRINIYEQDIDIQIDRFEQNLARQSKIDKSLDELSQKLLNLMHDFERTSSELDKSLFDESEIQKSIGLMEKEVEKANQTLSRIDQIRSELDEVAREKIELLNEDNLNLNRSRSGTLLEGFNETIFELDLCKDNEINSMLNKFHQDLSVIENKLKLKINEIKFKLEQQSINKKQKKLNLLRDTLDLQLDTLVSLKLYNQLDYENIDLAKESDDILLDKVALDDTAYSNYNSIELDKRANECETKKNSARRVSGIPVRIDSRQAIVKPTTSSSLSTRDRDPSPTSDVLSSTNSPRHDKNFISTLVLPADALNTTANMVVSAEKSSLEDFKINKDDNLEETYEHATIDYVITENPDNIYMEENKELVEQYTNSVDSLQELKRKIEEDMIDNERRQVEYEIMQREIDDRERLQRIEKEIAHGRAASRDRNVIRSGGERSDVFNQESEVYFKVENDRIESDLMNMLNGGDDSNTAVDRREREYIEMQKLAEIEHLTNVKREKEMILEQLEIESLNKKAQQQQEQKTQHLEQSLLKLCVPKTHTVVVKGSVESSDSPSDSHDSDLELFEKEEKMFQELERQKQQEEVESEKRAKRLEIMEQERQKQLEKLRFEERLSDICERLNVLKEKFNSIGIESLNDEYNALNAIDVYNSELLSITDEIRSLSNQPHSIILVSSNATELNHEYYLCNTLDQVTLTQFDLIKKFITNLNDQIEAKKNEIMRKQITKSQLNECQDNIQKLTELALKYMNQNGTPANFYCERIDEIHDRIQSVESLETSIRTHFNQLNELTSRIVNNENRNYSNCYLIDQAKIETEILKPLSAYSASLKSYLLELKAFETEFDQFKHFLNEKLNLDELIRLKNKDAVVLDLNRQGLMQEYERMYGIRESLKARLTESNDIFLRGCELYDAHKQQRVGLVLGSCKEFYELKDLIDEVGKFLDERCALMSHVIKEQNRLDLMSLSLDQIRGEVNDFEHEFEQEIKRQLVVEHVKTNENTTLPFKVKLDTLAEIKKRLKSLGDEKEKTSVELREFCNIELKDHENTLLSTKFEALAKRFNNGLKNELEDTIRCLTDKVSHLELRCHEVVMKHLPSRSALFDIGDWLISRAADLDQIDRQFRSEKTLSLVKLDSYKHQLAKIAEEMRSEREPQLAFILDSIEKEIKEGFYDLIMSEQCNQLECDWNRFKLRLTQHIEVVEMGIVKLNEFNRDMSQIRASIEERADQNEYAQINDESTIIFTDFNSIMNNTSCLDTSVMVIDEDKNNLKQIGALRAHLNELKTFWLSMDTRESENMIELHMRNALRSSMTQIFDELSGDLDRIELKNKLKLENNFTQLKKNYSVRINELNSLLDNEVNFLSHGNIINSTQYEKSIQSLKDVLIKLDDTKTEMKQLMVKFENDYESQAVTTDGCGNSVEETNTTSEPSSISTEQSRTTSSGTQIKRILSLAKNKIGKYDLNGLLVEASLKQSILASVTNKNLENRAKQLIDESEEVAQIFRRYDDLQLSTLNKLEKTKSTILNGIENMSNIVTEESPVTKSSLLEDVLADVAESKMLFDEFEIVVKKLDSQFAFNEALKSEMTKVRVSVQEKLNELSVLSDKLNSSMEEACQEQRLFASLVESTQQAMDKARHFINAHKNIVFKSQNKIKFDLRSYVNELEICENELNGALIKFKGLNIKDSRRIKRVYELITPCTSLLDNLTEIRVNLVSMAEEQTQMFDVELNNVEMYIRGYESRLKIAEQDENSTAEEYLDNLLGCIKSMINADLEMSKHEIKLDQLEANSYVEFESKDDSSRLKHLRNVRNTLSKLRRQVRVITQKSSLFDELLRLREISNEYKSTGSLIYGAIDLAKMNKLVQNKEEFNRLKSSLERISFELEADQINLYAWDVFKSTCLIPIEAKLDSEMEGHSKLSSLLEEYRVLLGKIEFCINEAEGKLASGINTESAFLAIRENEFDRLEFKLDYLKDIKHHLLNPDFKKDLDLLKHVGHVLEKSNLVGISIDEISKHKKIEIRYFDIMCRLDQTIKQFDHQCSSLKKIVSMSQRLLDQISESHKLLSGVTMKGAADSTPGEFEESTVFNFERGHQDDHNKEDPLDDQDFGPSTMSVDLLLSNKFELKNTKNLGQMIDLVRFGIINKLNESEPVKNEILRLCQKSQLSLSLDEEKKLNFVKEIVNKLLDEWNLINDKCVEKLRKLEGFKNKITALDQKLNQVRESLLKWESLAQREVRLDLNNYNQLVNSQREMELLLETIKREEIENEALFKICLHANKHYFKSNKHNRLLIMNLIGRWNKLKTIVSERAGKLNQLVVFLNDLNDQIEKFYTILNRTESFYQNMLSNKSHESKNVLKLVDELYQTIKEDYKLIKYLNESYVNFARLVGSLDFSYECLDYFRKKLLSLNSRWDSLHNQIAVKINLNRKHSFAKNTLTTKEKVLMWANEMSLLVTNLEHLSAKELQQKYTQVQEIKREVLEHIDHLLKHDRILGSDSTVIQVTKDIMKRVIRIDSYIKESTSHSKVTVCTSSSTPLVSNTCYKQQSRSVKDLYQSTPPPPSFKYCKTTQLAPTGFSSKYTSASYLTLTR